MHPRRALIVVIDAYEAVLEVLQDCRIAQQATKLLSQVEGAMKTTLDLPDHLMQQVKQRALQQGRPIKELVADYIRQGLHGPAALPLTTNSGVLEVDAEGLPLFRPDPRLKRHSIDVATALRLEQDTLMQEDRQRAGRPAL